MSLHTFVFALSLTLMSAVSASADDICVKAEKKAGGEIALKELSKASAKGVLACAYMSASTDAVYAALTDYPTFPKWIDKVDAIKAEWQDAETALVDYEIGTMFGTYKYQLRRVHQKPFSVKWDKVKGDLKTVTGRYEFRPIAGDPGSFLIIETYVDPGVPMPGFIEAYFSQKGSRRLIEDVRDEVKRRQKR